MLVGRIHSGISFVHDLPLVDHHHGLNSVVRVHHVLVERQFTFLGRERDLVTQIGSERLFERPVNRVRLRHRGMQHFAQVQVVVQRVISTQLIMEVLELLPCILGELQREGRFGAADRQSRLCAGNFQVLGQRIGLSVGGRRT